ncbi:CDGSH iron-sulfur domain-containing protein [Magnetovibrio sp.]|uniref:CDGSH iron-sulfur domain-containing protein n=1 Tax=Magnetovibrio sp. TaxID=2024836 RepID=UPI002F951DDC
MSKPEVAADHPVEVVLEIGKKYAWCACGRSKTQPYCDGSHKGTDHQPVVFTAKKSGQAWLCMCKQTKNPPYCDGAHNALEPKP